MTTVQLQDFKMHYIERGAGAEPVVFLHGFIASHRWWLPALDRLPHNFHAFVPDWRGAGNSEQVDTGHTLAQYAADLQQFVDAMRLPKFTLVAHSLGGGVAMQYALEHQERLNALVLVSPLAPFGMRIDQPSTDWINSVQGQPAGQRMIILGAFATPPTGEYLETLVADAVAWGKPIYLGTMADMARFDISQWLGEIQVPTLITWGDKDTVIPFEGIVAAFTKIPGAGLEIWHGVGHSGQIEQPDRFIALLSTFLQEAATASRAKAGS